MTDVDPLTVAVVDDDEEVRTALRRLLRSMGHDVHVFASAEDYEERPALADCLIVDLRHEEGTALLAGQRYGQRCPGAARRLV